MTIDKKNGFTLVEVAIVMVIIGLLMGGGLVLVRALTEQRFRNESKGYLDSAKRAVITFSQINGRLPWADAWADTSADGFENTNLTNGRLPYATIGLSPSDAFNRRIRYRINPGLDTNINPITNMVSSCNVLMGALSGPPQIFDADAGAGAAVPVAAVIISSGAMDADSNGNVFDAIAGGNNANGNPYYVRSPPVQGSFDDLAVYITGNELFGDMCEALVLTVNDTTGLPIFWVWDVTRNANLGSSSTGTYKNTIISGTTIEIRTASGGGGAIIASSPPTPIALAGQDRTITVP